MYHMTNDKTRTQIGEFEPLVDLCTVQIDTAQPLEVRKKQYLEQIKDPLHFRVGNREITLVFEHNERTLEQCMQGYWQTFTDMQLCEQEGV